MTMLSISRPINLHTETQILKLNREYTIDLDSRNKSYPDTEAAHLHWLAHQASL